jgi:hypothetical protein
MQVTSLHAGTDRAAIDARFLPQAAKIAAARGSNR